MSGETRHRIEDIVLYAVSILLLAGLAFYFVRANQRLEARLLDAEYIGRTVAVDEGVALDFNELQLRIAGLRYRHAAFGVFGQETRRNAGFLIGSLLIVLGGLFVLRRLETGVIEAEGGASGGRGGLRTTSPGVFMAALGTLIVCLSLWISTSTTVDDRIAPEVSTSTGTQTDGTYSIDSTQF